MPEISVNYSNLPHGKMVTIPGLGVFPNGMRSNAKEKRFKAYQNAHPDWDGNFGGGDKAPEPEAPEAEAPPVAVKDMTKNQLLEVAAEQDIAGYSSMTKKELLEAISKDDA